MQGQQGAGGQVRLGGGSMEDGAGGSVGVRSAMDALYDMEASNRALLNLRAESTWMNYGCAHGRPPGCPHATWCGAVRCVR